MFFAVLCRLQCLSWAKSVVIFRVESTADLDPVFSTQTYISVNLHPTSHSIASCGICGIISNPKYQSHISELSLGIYCFFFFDFVSLFLVNILPCAIKNDYNFAKNLFQISKSKKIKTNKQTKYKLWFSTSHQVFLPLQLKGSRVGL